METATSDKSGGWFATTASWVSKLPTPTINTWRVAPIPEALSRRDDPGHHRQLGREIRCRRRRKRRDGRGRQRGAEDLLSDQRATHDISIGRLE